MRPTAVTETSKNALTLLFSTVLALLGAELALRFMLEHDEVYRGTPH